MKKNITVEIVDADPQALPEDVIDLNPYGTPPTLTDRDLVLYESRILMEYLDERFPHPPLLPVYPVARAHSRQLIHRIERDWCGHVDALLAGSEKEPALAKRRKELRESLIAVAPVFIEKPFFMNEEFTLVDCAVAPILWRLPLLDLDLPAKQCKPMLEYAERMFDRDSFQASLSEAEREMRSGL